MKRWVNRKVETKGSLAVNIISRDEEKTIKRAIESVAGLADEIIVVDTGSKDNTIKEAAAAGARVYEEKWDDDFSKPRNKALDMSRAGWILSLDADEVIPKRGREEITHMISRPEIAGWKIETWNYCKGARMLDIRANRGEYEEGKGYGFYVGSIKTRVFQRREGVRWCFPIHELVDWSITKMGGRTEDAKIKIQHLHDKEGKEEIKRKTEFYLRLCEKKVRQYPQMGHAWGELAVCELNNKMHMRAARSWYNAIKYGEDTSKNRYSYAGVLRIMGHTAKSDQEIERAICKDFPNLTTIN